jgi:predicted metal-dependent phosphoesterase TrpH
VAKEIWRATDEQARGILVEKGIELTEEETLVLIDHLPLYLDIALEECVLALARQQLRRRERGNGERAGGTGD